MSEPGEPRAAGAADAAERRGGDEPADRDTPRPSSRGKQYALWAGLAVCVAFLAWVAWGLIQFDHALEHPQEGGFSGWQCEPGRDCSR
ncbi:hypothetical protein RM572_01370 [Streptomyces sp. DSM 42041]|uniref:Uncharacterized protein n=1 Tax=Streptomyces hazeniae TaxID=3075538 RepID=A0ABU2NKA8_9ACTN|nr:hypothetical protein [Streptomyces sp. DSM 42041]MDT0377424.1 hypothetical protein [Streptomyces sp. DSM 42041]